MCSSWTGYFNFRRSRPRDIYHPNFRLGLAQLTSTSRLDARLSLLLFPLLLFRLGWLQLPVRGLKTTSISILLTSLHSTCVQVLGVWTPSTLSTLFSIADRSTVKNGLPSKVARHQLLQQLSVILWHYNARIILRQYALSCDDDIVFSL